MANFDLISEDDFFSEEKKSKPEKPSPEKPQPEEDLFTKPEQEEVFSADELTETPDISLPDESSEAVQDFSEDLNENFDFSDSLSEEVNPEIPPVSPVAPESSTEPADEEPEIDEFDEEPGEDAVRKESYEMSDYYDEKQTKINYKPFIWSALALVAVIILFFVGKMYLFDRSGPETAETEQKNAQPAAETTGPSPEEVRRTNYFASLAANTNQTVSDLNGISGAAMNQATLSSVLFYGNDLTFEVFAKNRDALAKLNILLKKNFKNKDIQIVSSQIRPGSKGGVLGVYKLRLAGSGASGGAAKSTPFNDVSQAENWLSAAIVNEGLKTNNLNKRALGNKDGFKLSELDATISGNQKACLSLIRKVGASGKNIKVSKLSLNTTDQQNFNPNRYQLRLILQVFM